MKNFRDFLNEKEDLTEEVNPLGNWDYTKPLDGEKEILKAMKTNNKLSIMYMEYAKVNYSYKSILESFEDLKKYGAVDDENLRELLKDKFTKTEEDKENFGFMGHNFESNGKIDKNKENYKFAEKYMIEEIDKYYKNIVLGYENHFKNTIDELVKAYMDEYVPTIKEIEDNVIESRDFIKNIKKYSKKQLEDKFEYRYNEIGTLISILVKPKKRI